MRSMAGPAKLLSLGDLIKHGYMNTFKRWYRSHKKRGLVTSCPLDPNITAARWLCINDALDYRLAEQIGSENGDVELLSLVGCSASVLKQCLMHRHFDVVEQLIKNGSFSYSRPNIDLVATHGTATMIEALLETVCFDRVQLLRYAASADNTSIIAWLASAGRTCWTAIDHVVGNNSSLELKDWWERWKHWYCLQKSKRKHRD